jgi:hypothetical protein
MVGDHVELVGRHLEHRTGIDRHRPSLSFVAAGTAGSRIRLSATSCHG